MMDDKNDDKAGVDERPEPENFGDEGGSSQWGQTVLTPEGVRDRTVSRDRKPVSGEEKPKK